MILVVCRNSLNLDICDLLNLILSVNNHILAAENNSLLGLLHQPDLVVIPVLMRNKNKVGLFVIPFSYIWIDIDHSA